MIILLVHDYKKLLGKINSRWKHFARTQDILDALLSGSLMYIYHTYDGGDSYRNPLMINTQYGRAFYISGSYYSDNAVLAISINPIGIDAEVIGATKVEASFVRKFFCPEEALMLRMHLYTNFRFLAIWTRKEAFLKCTCFRYIQTISGLSDLNVLSASPVTTKPLRKHSDLLLRTFIDKRGFIFSICSGRVDCLTLCDTVTRYDDIAISEDD